MISGSTPLMLVSLIRGDSMFPVHRVNLNAKNLSASFLADFGN